MKTNKLYLVLQVLFTFTVTLTATWVLCTFVSGSVLSIFLLITNSMESAFKDFVLSHLVQIYFLNGLFVTLVIYGIILVRTFKKPKQKEIKKQ